MKFIMRTLQTRFWRVRVDKEIAKSKEVDGVGAGLYIQGALHAPLRVSGLGFGHESNASEE